MTSGERYIIIKRVKIHTKPLVTADIILEGTYKYETDDWYCFNEFKVKKSNVIKIKEI